MAEAEPIRARDGRALGEKAIQTRSSLLQAVDSHLQDTDWRNASVTVITGMAGVKSVLFYYYFSSIEEALAELISEMKQRGCPVPEHLRKISELIEFEASRRA